MLSEGFLPDVVDQLFNYIEIDVCFEQGDTNLAQGLADVFLGDGALAAEILECPLKLIG
jgi:hypothetical protein